MKSLLHKFLKYFFNLFGLRLVQNYKNKEIYNVERVIDVGVGLGTEELLNKYPNSYFVYIEPHPYFQDYIEKNLLKKTQEKEKGVLLKFGAGENEGEFYLRDNYLDSSLLNKHETINTKTIKVKIRKIDDLLDEINFFKSSANTILKIDTEGYELSVLKGATKLLKSSCVKFIQLEVRLDFIEGSYNPSDIFVYLNKFDYVFKSLDKIGYRKNGISHLDITFEKIFST